MDSTLHSTLQQALQQAVDWLQNADALLVTAGAGMGVDSGLPDFRGTTGFWRAYPMYQRLGLRFEEAANPLHFKQDPEFAWGFYGHRLNLYRATEPHLGFSLIQQWVHQLHLDLFVVTSNVDGQFQKAQYSEDRIWEIHGSIHHLQCVQPCSERIIDNRLQLQIDTNSMRATEVPRCDLCHDVARPNILMFGDWEWISHRSDGQQQRFQAFIERNRARRLLVLELGAGTALPTIRHLSERVAKQLSGHCVRINPREPQISPPFLGLASGALAALQGMDAMIKN